MSTRRFTAGAKAGIGIGVVLGAVILLALAFITFRHRQKRNASSEPKTDTYDEEQSAGLPVIHEQLVPMRAVEPAPRLQEVSLPEIGSIASFGALPGLRKKTPVPEPAYMESNGRALADRKTKGSSVGTHQEALKALKALNISATPPSTSLIPAKDGPASTE